MSKKWSQGCSPSVSGTGGLGLPRRAGGGRRKPSWKTAGTDRVNLANSRGAHTGRGSGAEDGRGDLDKPDSKRKKNVLK